MTAQKETTDAQALSSSSDLLCVCAARSQVDCCCEGVDWRSDREKQLESLVVEFLEGYLKHDSWRCERYKECHCGLDALLDSAGFARIPC